MKNEKHIFENLKLKAIRIDCITILIGYRQKEIKIDIKYFKVWISLIRNLGYKRYQKLIQEIGSKESLWNASKKQLLKIDGIGEKLAEVYIKTIRC